MKNLPFLFTSVCIGIILFQCIMVAPAINKLINSVDASVFLRNIWPKFFLIIAIISLISLITIIINSNRNLFKYLSFLSFLLMTFCYLITPVINNAKDSSNEQLWSTLHLVTIILTALTLIFNILTVYYWDPKN